MKNVKQLEAWIEKMMFFQDIPGLAIGATKGSDILYAKGFGVMNIDTQEPVTDQTIFHMASITKLFVATAVMQLAEQKKVDLHKRVIDYIPYFRIQDDRYKKITVLQLLSHTSGMPDCLDYGWDKPEYDEGALERYVRGLKKLSLLNNPGEKFTYSNIGYEILGHLVAVISGESFENYIQCHILNPLRMHDSTLATYERKLQILASPHIKTKEKKVIISKIFPYHRAHAPSSTLTSNIVDMCCWARANLNKGAFNDIRILKASSYDHLWRPIANIKFQQEEIGIGWFLSRYHDRKIMGHEGSDIGFRTSFAIMPQEDLAVCVMANIDRASTKKIMKNVFDWILGFENENIL
ncbi:serine hydrolase [Clostridiaceae bacterium 35-E11]